MRKIKRLCAKYHMRNEGLSRICKHGKDEKSFFAKHWREFVR